MPRELSARDQEILKKLAPECSDEICAGSGHAFRSILPPVANHFAMGEADFADRIGRLSDDDLRYLVDLVRDGGEGAVARIDPEALEEDLVDAQAEVRDARLQNLPGLAGLAETAV